jgi:hypothetical protein
MFFPHVSPDIFFSLLGKVADEDRAAGLRKLFDDPVKFAGEWILPTISRDDPEFHKQQYWRGKVWAPVNWLAYQGFKIYEWDREARMLADSSARMFLRPWRAKGHCYENFLSTTGEGSSDPHYTWGALMVLIAIEELIDVNPWHGLRFGNLQPVEEGAIERYPVADALYDVHVGPDGLEVKRDARKIIAADTPLEIRHVRLSGGRLTCEARSDRAARVWLGSGPAHVVKKGVTRLEGPAG